MVAGREGRGRVTYGREERGQNGMEGGREIDAGKGERRRRLEWYGGRK